VDDLLNILIVDDNPEDRVLAMRELRREFPNAHFLTVTDAKTFSHSLASGICDLVVTDNQLRWTDGITVLVAVKVRWPDCPVIMFTGSGNEEVAVQAMKAGLDDYVLKSARHYPRLAAAAVLAWERGAQRRALRQAETRYQSLFDDVPVGLFRVAHNGKIVDANPALAEMLEYPDREALLAVKVASFFADAKERRALLESLNQSGIVRFFEAQFYRRDGRIIRTEVNARIIRNHHEQAIYYEGSLQDISARKEAERSLRESEARKGAILDSAFDAVITIDDRGRIVEFNPAAEKMFCRARADVIGRELEEIIIPPSSQEKHHREFHGYLAAGQASMLGKRMETKGLRADGKEFPVELTVTRVNLEGPPMFTGFVRDITERKRAEKQLRDSREQLRALAAYLQSVREEERTRIAREVHDELGQALTGLKMDLAWLEKKMAEISDTDDLRRFEGKVKGLPGVADAIIGKIRKIATELRPPVLDDLGLEAAVEWQIQEFEKRTGIKCRFRCALKQVDLDSDRATAVFRIFQETLTNVVRHAEATEVNIQLREEDDRLILEVQDNGRGMTGREMSGARSLGLLGMRERATMLDGEVNIIGRQGKGTTVGVCIPIHRTPESQKK
jgi:PAS domain S-box-containing protein